MITADESDVQRAWRGSAPYWEKHRVLIEQMFAPLTNALIKEARISSGQKVLDVAGGTGEPALTIEQGSTAATGSREWRILWRATNADSGVLEVTSVWLPLSESGEIACPDCGACAVTWDGAGAYVAYWQREAR